MFLDINSGRLQELSLDLAATEKQVTASLSRALSRTATSLRVLAQRHLKDELKLRTVNNLRKRMKSLKSGGGRGIKMFFGLNEMPASWFKGTPVHTREGAQMMGQTFQNTFVGKRRNGPGKTVFKRLTPGHMDADPQLVSVQDKANKIIEDEIFVHTEEIFWKHFERDLRARVNYRLGNA